MPTPLPTIDPMPVQIPEPSSFGRDTPLPPDYLLAALTKDESKLVHEFLAAREAAREATEARNAAERAFREVSRTTGDGERIPAMSVTVDEWRVLQQATYDTELAARKADGRVKRAYLPLREALEASPAVAEAGEFTTRARHAVAIEALSALTAALAELADADRFTNLYSRREGFYQVTLAQDIGRITQAVRAVLDPSSSNPPLKAVGR